ncbi:hypothetical protein COLO4_36409 [Corchorus olitorius]|uniref:Glycosyltransferase family 92 protein n=1 Tax=Corchorus olitorius TaxID=93759 RepID=A0A1R3G925_9ROSI|nr:hypothetical protein COLO4_36409 [Corchorus olitorius]
MRRKAPTTLFLVFLCLLFTVFCSLLLSRNAISLSELRFHPQNINARPKDPDYSLNHVIAEDSINHLTHRTRHVSSIQGASVSVDSVSVLLPDWQVLVLVSPVAAQLISPAHSGESFYCLFPNKETSAANFSGVLPFTNATAFKCILPEGNRRHKPFRQPVLTRSPEKESAVISPAPVMPRWDFLVYESLSTETDVILFAKGVNNRQGINRPPEELSCVFRNEAKNTTVKTPVTVSMQEVFRCQHPDSTAAAEKVKVSLEIKREKQVIPSVAYYINPPRTEATTQRPKSKICATTMVYNVGKYLREWVMYYSKIGVDKFFLYDNESNDNLESIIKELNQEDDNYNIERILWIWPKTQEAGFSHSAVYGKDSCTWMMYVDVDEFIYSPSWLQNNSTQPSKNLLPSLLPSPSNQPIGQVSIKCNDFGPSEQRKHPAEGVIQGYNCRRRVEQRHKSIVRLDAVDDSLVNVIHHFGLNKTSGYGWKYLPMEVAAVNHYKYQAWPEFMTKFRRRVSAFVADWTTAVNPNSKDRTPGLGFEAIKPQRWEKMFCQVKDERLKVLTQRWFGFQTPEGLKLAWQT